MLSCANAECAGAELLKPCKCPNCPLNQAKKKADHSVLLSGLFFSLMSAYIMYCNLDVMDVHFPSL